MGYIQIGDIVWFGNTAALAWELPTDPDLFLKLKNLKKDKLYSAQNRDGGSKLIYYLDAKGNVLSKAPYRKYVLNGYKMMLFEVKTSLSEGIFEIPPECKISIL